MKQEHTKEPWKVKEWPDEQVWQGVEMVITDSRGLGWKIESQKEGEPK